MAKIGHMKMNCNRFCGKIGYKLQDGENDPRKLITTETRLWVYWVSNHVSQGELCVHSRN